MKSNDKLLLILGILIVLSLSNKSFTTYPIERDIDVVVVNDISGSMDDNCYCLDGTPSDSVGSCDGVYGNYHPDYPCKINDMKNATHEFKDIILFNEGNYLGLVTYDWYVSSYTELTRDNSLLTSHIDSYEAEGTTCTSCGIQKGTEILATGTNVDRIMLVMTDGESNYCIYNNDPEQSQSCTLNTAKQEAIDKANYAVNNYGVELYCIAFGGDADIPTMQAMCENGTFYYASELDLGQLYEDIGYELVPQADPTFIDVFGIFNQLWNIIWEIIKTILNWLSLSVECSGRDGTDKYGNPCCTQEQLLEEDVVKWVNADVGSTWTLPFFCGETGALDTFMGAPITSTYSECHVSGFIRRHRPYWECNINTGGWELDYISPDCFQTEPTKPSHECPIDYSYYLNNYGIIIEDIYM